MHKMYVTVVWHGLQRSRSLIQTSFPLSAVYRQATISFSWCGDSCLSLPHQSEPAAAVSLFSPFSFIQSEFVADYREGNHSLSGVSVLQNANAKKLMWIHFVGRRFMAGFTWTIDNKKTLNKWETASILVSSNLIKHYLWKTLNIWLWCQLLLLEIYLPHLKTVFALARRCA